MITCSPPLLFAGSKGDMLFFVGNFGLSSTNEEAHDRFGIVDFLVKPIVLELSDHLFLFKRFMWLHDKLNVAVCSPSFTKKTQSYWVIPNNRIQYELTLFVECKLTTLGGEPLHHFLPHIRLLWSRGRCTSSTLGSCGQKPQVFSKIPWWKMAFTAGKLHLQPSPMVKERKMRTEHQTSRELWLFMFQGSVNLQGCSLPVIPAEVKGLLGMDFGVQIPPNPKVFWKPRVYVEQTKSLDWVGVFIFRVYLHPCGKWWNFTSIFIKWSWNHQPVEGSKFLELRSICEKDELLGNTRDLLIFRLRKKRVVSIVDYIELLRCTGAYIPGNSLWPFWDG